MRYSFILVFLLGLVSITRAQEDTLIIHFDLNKASIRPVDVAALDSLSGTMRIRSITLAGHADSTGNDRINDSLSLARAVATRNYLLSKGLSGNLIKSIEGYGRRQPHYSTTPDLNRRVEIIVTLEPARPQPLTQSPPPPVPSPSAPAPNTFEDLFKDTTNLTGRNFILRNVNFY